MGGPPLTFATSKSMPNLLSTSPPQRSPARYVAMKDSWISGDDRRDRGRVDRGVTRQRRSRSPTVRRHESDREPKGRERSPGNLRSIAQHERSRDRAPEHRRRPSRSPRREGEAVREKNRGRELLLDTRGSDKSKRSTTHPSPSSSKRRKSRSPSPPRNHHKKSRRAPSQSPLYPDAGSLRPERRHRALSPPPPRRRSPERRSIDIRGEGKPKQYRESKAFDRRGRSPSPRRDRLERHDFGRHRSPSHRDNDSRRNRSPPPAPFQKPRERSPYNSNKPKDTERRREQSPHNGRQSPDIDRYEPANRSRQESPPAPRGPKAARGQSPKRDRGRPPPSPSSRDEYRPGKPKPQPKGGKPAASGANSIEVKGARTSGAASGANSIEVKSDKMAGRGFYGGQQGYNPHQQMQAAFPLKPQYNQGPQVDPRQYSQSPQHHMTPNSYQGSPQAHSPYSAGRGNWGGQQQYSPQPQYPQNYQQQPNYATPNGPQGQYYNNQSQSPPYHTPSGPMNQPYQSNFRGSQRGFRGNHFNNRGGRGDHRGRGGNHFQNTQWNSGGVGRGQHSNSGNVTPQHASPQQQYPPQSGFQEGTPQYKSQPEEEEEADDLFRPSKELQVEDKADSKKKDEEEMPPPSKPTPTGPQSQQNSSRKGFSFAFKGAAKPATVPKPEISQKLTVGPTRKDVQVSPERSRGPPSRGIPTEPASVRRAENREPAPPPTTRMVKKIMRRRKALKVLPEDFKKSDSVYYRKPGNESVVGSGTYGKVFKAIHVYTKDLVALKKIRMEGERDGFPVTAVREIKLLQSLKHANIVNLHEVMVEKNDCFMVFEYLSHDLTGLLNHPSFKLEPAHKKHLAKQLFEGLDYLHRRGVLHRDIKAANILVSKDGQLKIADFGLARFYAKRRQLDYTNRVITIWYRSPELLLGETQYGPAVDIWSAACVLVEIFTRHAIFPGDGGEISQLEKIYAILGTPNKTDWPGLVDMAWFELLRPSARRPNVFAEKYKERVTPAAYELLEAMFHYDPAKRPSASEVLDHPYFAIEEPMPRQVHELAALDGDWHEFESKALRKENERKDKARRAAAQKEKEAAKKRAPEGEAADSRDPKRMQMGPPSLPVSIPK